MPGAALSTETNSLRVTCVRRAYPTGYERNIAYGEGDAHNHRNQQEEGEPRDHGHVQVEGSFGPVEAYEAAQGQAADRDDR